MSRPDDDLRARLAALDPAGTDVPVDPVTSPRAAAHLERAMLPTDTTTSDPTTGTTTVPARRPRVRRALAAGLLAGAAAATATALWLGGGGEPGGEAPSTLALTLPPSDVASSCIVFDVTLLADMPVAFAGTATAVEPGLVTLEVDRWYRGGDAEQVTLSTPAAGTSAVLDGVDFRAGERYLVTATRDGAVNGCGFSGPAAPELQQAFDTAFG